MVTKRRRSREASAGVTLVELMVTLAIAGFVASATFAFFAGQQRIYDVQSKLLGIQQNLWSSMDTLSRYARSAGNGMLGCVRADSDGAGPDLGDPPPGSATAPLTGLRAFRAGAMTRIAPIWIQNGAAGAPDTLTVAFGQGASGAFTDASLAVDVPIGQPTASIVTPAGQSVRFMTGEFALLIERSPVNGDRGCTLFQITDVISATNLLAHTAVGSSWNPSADVAALIPFTYKAGATPTGGIRNFGQLVWVQFAIDSTGAPAVPPTLTMNRLDGSRGPEVLADGIEDMQIAYACDLTTAGPADGVLTEGTDSATRLADEWTYNEAGDVPPLSCNRPDAIRITLIARSLTPDTLLANVTTNRKPAAEDGVQGPVDSYRHRVATISLYPRN